MIKPNIICGISVLMIISFSTCKQNTSKIEKEIILNEDKLIKDLFWELSNPLPPFAPEDSTMEAFEMFGSKYATWLEKNDFELYLRDSIFVPEPYWYRKKIELGPFDSLYNRLFQDQNLRSRLFNLPLINKRSNFKIMLITPDIESDTLFQNIKDKTKFAGYVQFSRIKFDQKFNRACFFFDKHLGHLSGGGMIIYAEKKNGRWRIVNRDLVYVS